MWQAETNDVRAKYKKLAEFEKNEHLRLYPNYRYQPRKPSEKKRRMSKKKADAIGFQKAEAYLSQNQVLGELHGDLGEIRNASLPLSYQAELRVAKDNQSMVGVTISEGFGLAHSSEYAATQAADIDQIGEHMGPEFFHFDPAGFDELIGEPADGFNFALHAMDFPEDDDDKD